MRQEDYVMGLMSERISRILSFLLTISLVFPHFTPAHAEDLNETCGSFSTILEDSSRTTGNSVDGPSLSGTAKRDNRLSTSPETPLQLTPKVVKRDPVCKRLFLFKGKLDTVDSYNRQDGEKLRPILSDTPAALAELDEYQANRRKVRISAYMGTAGLLIALGSVILSNQFDTATRNTVRNIGLISGLSIGVGFTVYSLAVLRTNEAHLQKAVDRYNEANPSQNLELRFTTGILF